MSSTERERRLARLRLERQRERALQLQRRRKRQRRLAGALAAVLVVAGCVLVASRLGGGVGTADPSPTSTALPCSYSNDASSNPLVTTRPTPPGFGSRRDGTATMVTNRGTIRFQLLANDAPCATTSMAFLAGKKYFDGTTCSRLTTDGLRFLQCGEPAVGTGPGYTFPDENLTEGTTYPAGTVAMANRGPNTNGSEFFLVYGETELPPQFVPFGRITSGLEVLREIARGGATPEGDGAPNTATTITTLRTSGT